MFSIKLIWYNDLFCSCKIAIQPCPHRSFYHNHYYIKSKTDLNIIQILVLQRSTLSNHWFKHICSHWASPNNKSFTAPANHIVSCCETVLHNLSTVKNLCGNSNIINQNVTWCSKVKSKNWVYIWLHAWMSVMHLTRYQINMSCTHHRLNKVYNTTFDQYQCFTRKIRHILCPPYVYKLDVHLL